MPVSRGKLAGIELEVTMAYKNGLKSAPKPLWTRIAQQIRMKTKMMEAPIFGMIGPMREWLGPRVVERLARYAYSIVARKFEKTVAVPREAVDDDTYDVYMPQMSDLGGVGVEWPDVEVFKKLETGEVDKCYDGLSFFNANHPVELGEPGTAVFSNLLGTNGVAWYLLDTSKSVKPMIFGLRDEPELVNKWSPDDHSALHLDEYISFMRARGVADYGMPHFALKSKAGLDAAGFATALTTMTTLKAADGNTMGIRPTLAVIPPILEPAAIALWGVPVLANGQTNPWYKAIEWVVASRLSSIVQA